VWDAWARGKICTGFWWGKTEGKRTLGRPVFRWEENIKIDLREVGWGMAQDRDRWWAVLSAVMNLRVT
jgi:hypothetical protein